MIKLYNFPMNLDSKYIGISIYTYTYYLNSLESICHKNYLAQNLIDIFLS